MESAGHSNDEGKHSAQGLTQGAYLYNYVLELSILGRGVDEIKEIANGLEHPWKKETFRSKLIALKVIPALMH